MKFFFIALILSFCWFISSAQQNLNDHPHSFTEPAEILYVPGLNVDSVDKSSPVPRLLFVPEKNISEFNMLWGGHNFYLLSVTALPDKLVDSFKKKLAKKERKISRCNSLCAHVGVAPLLVLRESLRMVTPTSNLTPMQDASEKHPIQFFIATSYPRKIIKM